MKFESAVTSTWYLFLCSLSDIIVLGFVWKNMYPYNKQATQNMPKIIKSRFNF